MVGLHGKTAIVTGAGLGLGRDVALTLARLGMNVMANNCVRSVDQHAPLVDGVVEEIRKLGAGGAANVLDLRDEGAGETLVADALSFFGGLDLVIHNAGIEDTAFMGSSNSEILRAAMDSSFFAANALTRAACPVMRQRGGGSILYMATPGRGISATAKAGREATRAALYAYMRTVAIEGREHGIAANAVAPILEPRQRGNDGNAGPGDAVFWLVRWLANQPAPLTGATFLAGGTRVKRIEAGRSDELVLSGTEAQIFQQLGALTENVEGGSLKDFRQAAEAF